MRLHTYTPNQCPYQVSTSYTLQFLRYRPDKLLPAASPPARPPTHPDTMGENKTPTALKGCGIKKVDNFQRNACSGHLVFQNEANFSSREAYPLMKISCKFGEPSLCSFPLRALTPKTSLCAAVATIQ